MKYISWILLATSIAVCNCSGEKGFYEQAADKWKRIEANLHTINVIGTDSSSFFAHPFFLVTDSQGRIIVADRGRNQLLAFNQAGDFLYTIGERGPGPGEFRNISGMGITKKDKLFIFDASSQTFEEFTTEGKYLKSYVIETSIFSRIDFEQWKDFYFLFFSNYRSGKERNNALSVFSRKFDLKGKYIDLMKMERLPDIASSILGLDVGSYFINEKDELFFTSNNYNGIIYKYAISNSFRNGVNIKLINTYQGLVHKVAVERFKGEKSLEYWDAQRTLSGGRGAYQYLIHNQSIGLFKLSNGKTVHFTYIENNEGTQRTLGVEIYDKNMNPIGYAPLKTIEFKPNQSFLLSWHSLWKDKNDRFYVIDSRGIPKVRVFTLEIETGL